MKEELIGKELEGILKWTVKIIEVGKEVPIEQYQHFIDYVWYFGTRRYDPDFRYVSGEYGYTDNWKDDIPFKLDVKCEEIK